MNFEYTLEKSFSGTRRGNRARNMRKASGARESGKVEKRFKRKGKQTGVQKKRN